MATISRMPMFCMESWKTLAVPWKAPVMVAGRVLAASSISSVAWPSEMPGLRAKEMVTDVLHGILEDFGGALEGAGDGSRESFGSFFNFVGGLAERDAGLPS